MTQERGHETTSTRPANLPAGSFYHEGDWYYRDSNKNYIKWTGELNEAPEATSETTQSTDVSVRQPLGEFSLNISGSGEGLLLVERALGQISSRVQTFDAIPQATLIYDTPPYQGDPAEDPDYQAYLKSFEKTKEIEAPTQNAQPSAETENEEYPSLTPPAPVNISDIDTLEEALARKKAEAEAADARKRQSHKRSMLNMAIVSLTLIASAVVVAKTPGAAAYAREECTPEGVSGFIDVMTHPGCYLDEFKDYLLDVSKFNPWSQ